MTPVEEALVLAVEHLQYCGWGDAWERESAEEIKPQIMQAYEEIIRRQKEVAIKPTPSFPCTQCKKAFKTASSLKHHTRDSHSSR